MRRTLLIFSIILGLTLLSNVATAQNVAQGVKVIVIDAGHGGCYTGASYGGYNEKDINLKVALKLGDIIKKQMPHIKVIYTRTVEKQFSTTLSTDLQERANIAHRNQGDLFISIHANAHNNRAVCGVETLIMGESPRETAANKDVIYNHYKDELLDMSNKKTAAIVRAYIQNLQFTYGEYSEMMARLIQEEYVKLGFHNRGVRRQPLKVLYATDMPSVLTEIGFMSNAADLKYITSQKGQQEIAQAIFRAVSRYVENVNRLAQIAAPKSEAPKSEAPATQPAKQATATAPKSSAKAQPTKQSSATATTSTSKSATKSTAKSGDKSSESKATESKPSASKSAEKTSYTVQIMASNKSVPSSDAQFKSYRNKVKEYIGGGLLKYKYCVGDYSNREAAQEAAKRIKEEFPSAFIVTLTNGEFATK